MRDPNRMKPLLDTILQYWEKQPDTRLCQLLSNVAFESGWRDNDLFYYEDDELQKSLLEQMEEG